MQMHLNASKFLNRLKRKKYNIHEDFLLAQLSSTSRVSCSLHAFLRYFMLVSPKLLLSDLYCSSLTNFFNFVFLQSLVVQVS